MNKNAISLYKFIRELFIIAIAVLVFWYWPVISFYFDPKAGFMSIAKIQRPILALTTQIILMSGLWLIMRLFWASRWKHMRNEFENDVCSKESIVTLAIYFSLLLCLELTLLAI